MILLRDTAGLGSAAVRRGAVLTVKRNPRQRGLVLRSRVVA